jgi:hypothetical protein
MASTRDDRMRTCVCLTFTASVVCLSVAYHARAMCTRAMMCSRVSALLTLRMSISRHTCRQSSQ